MKRVAVFGNAGGGKSTLAKRLAELTRLPLYTIDKIQFADSGISVSHETFLQAHADMMRQDEWIIDGYGSVATAWARFAAADTLVYIDLRLSRHYWWVTKRLIQGLFATPEGWPKGSPLWASSLSSYKVVGLCNRRLAPRYRLLIAEMAATKRVHHLRSPTEMRTFLSHVEREFARI